MIKDNHIIAFYFGTSKGIKGTAAHFGLPKSYVGSVINRYKRRRGIR